MSGQRETVNTEYELIVFSDDWFGLPFSCKHLLRHFLPGTKLVWVQTIGVRPPRFNLYDIRRAVQKLRHWTAPRADQLSNLPDNLEIVNPIQVPYNHLGFVRTLNMRLMLLALRSRARLTPGRTRVFLTTWPFLPQLVGHLGESLSVYYRVDDYSEFPGVRQRYLRTAERELIRKVDLVVATAERLTELEGTRARKVRYLPHGVDFEHFAVLGAPVVEGSSEGSSVARIPRPRIGFFGLISTWIDLDLIALLANRRPDWSFVFIGPRQIPAASLPQRANIHFLGPVPYEELPCHARQFDVALVPFKLNALTQSVNPLKLLEYFAMGLPVVSSPLPEVLKYRDHLLVAYGAEEFEAAISSALASDSDAGRAARRQIAEENSWKRRAMQLEGWIESALAEKSADCG